jgi:hypothetical protein
VGKATAQRGIYFEKRRARTLERERCLVNGTLVVLPSNPNPHRTLRSAVESVTNEHRGRFATLPSISYVPFWELT